MESSSRLLLLLAMTAMFAPHSAAETIASARFEGAVERYGHFALGRPHEYSRLAVTTSAGNTLVLELPEDEVFEDLAPRLVTLAAGRPQEILAIASRRNSGARLVLVGLGGRRLEVSAQSPAVGTPMRWLNPVGVADLDGDGQAEIAAVITPHIGGTLKVYRKQGRELVEIAALAGFSNHAYGSTELALSAPFPVAGRIQLLVPDATRRHLRIIALENSQLIETARCALPAMMTGPMRVLSPTEVSLALATGQVVIAPGECRR